MARRPHADRLPSRIQRLGFRVFPNYATDERATQRLVGLVGGGGTILVGIVNWFNYGEISRIGLVQSFMSSYTGLILLLGLISVGCGFWDHAVARWTHIGLFVFSGFFGAITANSGNITSAFFLVFAIILLAEYRVGRGVSWVLALMMLAGYVVALSIGYQDDVSRPVVTALASLITILVFVFLFGGVILRHRAQLRLNAAVLEDRIAERTSELYHALRERNVMLQDGWSARRTVSFRAP